MLKTYKIVAAGLYMIGHFRTSGVRLVLGRPEPCAHVDLSASEAAELLDVLGVDWEDGVFVQEALEGQTVGLHIDDTEHFYAVGDAFENASVSIAGLRA